MPTGFRHTTFGPPAGSRSTIPVSRQTPSRFGPSHCGQSSARDTDTNERASVRKVTAVNRESFKPSRIDVPLLLGFRLYAVLCEAQAQRPLLRLNFCGMFDGAPQPVV